MQAWNFKQAVDRGCDCVTTLTAPLFFRISVGACLWHTAAVSCAGIHVHIKSCHDNCHSHSHCHGHGHGHGYGHGWPVSESIKVDQHASMCHVFVRNQQRESASYMLQGTWEHCIMPATLLLSIRLATFTCATRLLNEQVDHSHAWRRKVSLVSTRSRLWRLAELNQTNVSWIVPVRQTDRQARFECIDSMWARHWIGHTKSTEQQDLCIHGSCMQQYMRAWVQIHENLCQNIKIGTSWRLLT